MSRIFISHSSVNKPEAIAVRDWLLAEGWDDLFLDFSRSDGIVPGQRWQQVIRSEAELCQAMLVLLSPAWLASEWCKRELWLAQTSGKTILGIQIEALPKGHETHRELAATVQLA